MQELSRIPAEKVCAIWSVPVMGTFLLDSHPNWVHTQFVQIIARSTLRAFWEREPRAELPLLAWYKVARAATWRGPADVKAAFGTSVDFVGDSRVIFDIGGNKYRLIVHFAYAYQRGLIKFVGTHKEYDAINPETV